MYDVGTHSSLFYPEYAVTGLRQAPHFPKGHDDKTPIIESWRFPVCTLLKKNTKIRLSTGNETFLTYQLVPNKSLILNENFISFF